MRDDELADAACRTSLIRCRLYLGMYWYSYNYIHTVDDTYVGVTGTIVTGIFMNMLILYSAWSVSYNL